MDLEKKLQQLKARYNELNAAMSDPVYSMTPKTIPSLPKKEVIWKR